MSNSQTAIDTGLASAAMARLIKFHAQAQRDNEWTFFVDEMYHPDCVYTCEYAGTMVVAANGIDEIKSTHYGRDMAHGWEDWTFPYIGTYVNGKGQGITHWMNRGPGRRANGEFYETPGVSFMDFTADGQIIRQLDMFDLAHQMKLCDELDAAGLLADTLRENWVLPMKQKLIEMLS